MKKIFCIVLAALCISSLISHEWVFPLSWERIIKYQVEFSNPTEGETNFSITSRANRWWIQTVDAQGNVGRYTSLTLDSNRYPHISYFDETNFDLKYTRWNGIAWISDTIDTVGHVGMYTSIALDSNDRPHISYYNETDGGTNGHLKYIHFDGNQWDNVTIDTGRHCGFWPSISIDSIDRPHISYCDWYKDDLKYTYFNQTWHINTVISGNVGSITSLALDSNDNPHISYKNVPSYDLKYAYFNGTQWINETIDQNGNVGSYALIGLDSNDHPHISYYDYTNHDLKYAFYNGNQWNITSIDTIGDVGYSTALAVDSTNSVHISYYDNTNEDIKYAFYDGNHWCIETVDSNGIVGWETSIEIDNDDNPHISYYDATNGDLKYAVLDNIHPTLDSDNSPATGTTGDPYHFNISATDNHFVDTMRVNFRHGRLGNNLSLSKVGEYWLGIINLTHDPGDLSYTVYVKDMAGNYNISSRQNVTVLDNDRPSLVTDHSTNAGTTGDNFIVTIEANDNVKVGAVYVNWSHGESRGNMSLNGAGDFWSGIIGLEDNLTNMTYTLYVNDTSDNFNISGRKNITVTDNDPPSIGAVSLNSPTTGDIVQFRVRANDNIGVVSVVLNWSHDRLGGDLELTRSAGSWFGNITIDHAVTDLIYSVQAWDTSNLTYVLPTENIEVFDNDKPTFIGDKSAGAATTGGIFNFSMNATDNIGVSSVVVIYRFENGTVRNRSMESVFHDTWNFSISIPSNVTFLNYSYIISDDAGNNLTTDSFSFPVGDDDPPVAEAGENVTVDQHIMVHFNASGSLDNLGIANYSWSFRYGGADHVLYGEMTVFTFDEVGIYNVTLNVTDFAGHGATDSFTVVVLDVTAPEADAGGNIEIDQGETVLFDGSTSGDNVGIVSYSWSFYYDGKDHILYGMKVNFTFSIAGDYSITLLVTDAAGNQGTANFTVRVRDITPPKAIVTIEDEIDQETEATLDASGSSDNVGIVRYLWSFVYDGNIVELNDTTPVFVFDIPGAYNISLTVSDSANNTGATHALLQVLDTENPVANITGRFSGIRIGETVAFDGTGSSDNVGIANWTWRIEGPGTNATSYGSMTNITFSEDGEYSITLTVEDGRGNSASETRSFEVDPDGEGKRQTTSAMFLIFQGVGAGVMILLGVGMVLFLVSRRRKMDAGKGGRKAGDGEGGVEDSDESVAKGIEKDKGGGDDGDSISTDDPPDPTDGD